MGTPIGRFAGGRAAWTWGWLLLPKRAAEWLDNSETTFATIWASAEAVKRLRSADFFADPTSLQAAEEAEKALIRLLVTLEARVSEVG